MAGAQVPRGIPSREIERRVDRGLWPQACRIFLQKAILYAQFGVPVAEAGDATSLIKRDRKGSVQLNIWCRAVIGVDPWQNRTRFTCGVSARREGVHLPVLGFHGHRVVCAERRSSPGGRGNPRQARQAHANQEAEERGEGSRPIHTKSRPAQLRSSGAQSHRFNIKRS